MQIGFLGSLRVGAANRLLFILDVLRSCGCATRTWPDEKVEPQGYELRRDQERSQPLVLSTLSYSRPAPLTPPWLHDFFETALQQNAAELCENSIIIRLSSLADLDDANSEKNNGIIQWKKQCLPHDQTESLMQSFCATV